MPAATCRMNAARSSSRWDAISASAGSSRRVGANRAESLMGAQDTVGGGPLSSVVGDEADELPPLHPGLGILVERRDVLPVRRVAVDRREVAPSLDARRRVV